MGKNVLIRPFSAENSPYKTNYTGQTDDYTENVRIPMERGDQCRHFGVNFIIVSSWIRSQRPFEYASIFTEESRFEIIETVRTNQVISQKLLDLKGFYWYHIKANYSGFQLIQYDIGTQL